MSKKKEALADVEYRKTDLDSFAFLIVMIVVMFCSAYFVHATSDIVILKSILIIIIAVVILILVVYYIFDYEGRSQWTKVYVVKGKRKERSLW